MTPVEIKNFAIHLGKNRVTLKPTSLNIEAGSSTVIIGQTGMGKSVLLKSVAGILPSDVFTFEGDMNINGIHAYAKGKKCSLTNWKTIQKAGLMFIPAETALALNAGLTIEQNLRLLAPGCKELIVKRLKEYFDLDYESYRKIYPDECSGGQLQRLTLMILLSRPGNLVLIDEPTVNLDRQLRVKFVEFLNKEILSDKSKTFIMVSHDIDFIRRLNLSQAFRLNEGELIKLDDVPQLDGYTRPEFGNGLRGNRIELMNVAQSYMKRSIFGSKKFTAFRNLSLDFECSKIYGVTGPSGCGKSTMVKAILRMLSETEGKIVMDGSDLVQLKPYEKGTDPKPFKPFRKKMQIVQQDSRFSFFPDLKIRDSFNEISKVGNDGSLEEFLVNLKAVGMREEHLDAYPMTMSSGENKRLDIARALTAKPQVLILDEPFAHIDFDSRLKLFKVIGDYLAKNPTILIVITHEQFDLSYFITDEMDFPGLVDAADNKIEGSGNGGK